MMHMCDQPITSKYCKNTNDALESIAFIYHEVKTDQNNCFMARNGLCEMNSKQLNTGRQDPSLSQIIRYCVKYCTVTGGK